MFESIEHSLNLKYLFPFIALVLLYIYLKFRVFSFWKKHNVPHEKPIIPVGSLSSDLLTKKIPFGKLLNFFFFNNAFFLIFRTTQLFYS